ncbi:MAG TPA: hypothetical protein VMH24_09530 [Candidatus Sulfotelmatobacter sp.]|nr:hypothetical protein [Candidatus Sulfotelmatobacter sp.]
MSQSKRGTALGMLVLIVAACSSPTGGTGTPVVTATPVSGPTAAPASVGAVATATAAPAAGTCPTAAAVGTALGVTVASPVSVAGGGAEKLPAGATGVACEYAGTSLNVIIELVANIDPSAIDLYSAKFPVAYTTVTGVGDQARAFTQPLSGGKDNEAVVATRGRTLVDITATATPATLAQLEAFVATLL